MFDLPLFLVNLGLCAVAILAAAHVREGKTTAVALAWLLSANFLFCALAYTNFAPKHAAALLGLEVSSKDTWMVADALFGCAAYALVYGRWWWGGALWSLALVQVLLHLAFQRGWLSSDVFYTDRLANVLHAEIAVFLVIGGPRLVQNIRAQFRLAAGWVRHRGMGALARQMGPRP